MMTKVVKLAFHWKRPSTVPFPKIWRRFEAKLPNGEVQKFKIQDLTPDRYEEAWQLCAKTIWTEEPIAKALKLNEDPILMSGIREITLKVMEQRVCLMAVVDEPEDKQPIAALSIMAAYSRNDEIITQLEGPKAHKYEAMMDALRENVNVFDSLGVDVYLEDYGTSVAPEFRGRHLALNIILSVEALAKELGIRAKTVSLSNLNLSSVAKKEKLEVLREVVYDDFRDAEGNIMVPVKEFKSVFYCGLKFS